MSAPQPALAPQSQPTRSAHALTPEDFAAIKSIVELVLSTWGVIDHEPQSLDEQRRLALKTLVEQSRLALGQLLKWPATDAEETVRTLRVATNLEATLAAFEKEFKL